MTERAGLLLRGEGGLHFIPAHVARSVSAHPEISKVPGADLGMALVGGEVVAVLTLGSAAGALVLCDVSGELCALAGLVPEAAGFFEQTEGGVRYNGETAPELDVTAALRDAELHLQSARWGDVHGSL